MTDLDALIAKQRARIAEPDSDTLNVALGGTLIELKFWKITGADWSMLAALHSPRPGVKADANHGYNSDSLPADYPVTSLTVDGDSVTKEKWQEIYSVIDSTHRKNVAAVLWGLNVYAVIQELGALGKASTGESAKKRTTPVNRASRRAASVGGSPRKSPGTSTTPKAV